MVVKLQISMDTLAILISGLYVSYTQIDYRAIPEYLYVKVAELLTPYLDEWDYNKLSFEDWIRTGLIIAPKELFNETELMDLKDKEIYYEEKLGNMIMIISMDVIK